MKCNCLLVYLLISVFVQFVFGVVCNVKSSNGGDDSAAIYDAFSQCSSDSTITFSASQYNWKTPTKTISTLSNVKIVLYGTIFMPASTDFASISHYIVLSGTNVAISGNGTIDGNGQVYWNAGKLGGPKILQLSLKGTSSVTGIVVANSPAQHISISGSQGLKISGIKILIDKSRLQAGREPKNTDGFDIGSSKNVEIIDVAVDNDDDCIAVNGGSSGVNNLVVSGLTCTGGHGISIGSLGKGNANDIVDGVIVSNVTFVNSKYGARLKSFLVDSSNKGYARNISYSNIVIQGSSTIPVCVTQNYCDGSNCGTGTSAFDLGGASFTNFKFSESNAEVVNIECDSTTKCGVWQFSNVQLPKNSKVQCKNVDSSQLKGLTCDSTLTASVCN